MAKKRKPGPLPKPPELVRNAQQTFLVTHEEKQIMADAADKLGKTVADVIRDRVLGYCRKVLEKGADG